MNRVIRLLAIVLVLAVLTPDYATAASFGRTTAGATPSGGLRTDFKRGSKFVLSEPGVLQQICAYLDANGGVGGSQGIRYALYRDQNGVPGQQAAVTNSVSLPASTSAPNWTCLGVYTTVLDPGSYWLVVHSGDQGGVVRYYYDGPANWYGNADPWIDNAAETFGPGSTGDGTLSIRADYVPLHSAGATTVGTTVSSPMSAQMKRGSSFMLTEGALLWRLNAYIDAQGGAGGSQPLWLALYNDVNGEPSSLVAKAQVDPGAAGSAGHWVSALVSAPTTFGSAPIWLMPGRYWIVLYSGAPGGVLRYYMTGTGNWRGNANPGAEPSDFFGSASTGNGTITANISYTTEEVLHQTMGRTTPGTIPSGPLSANYIRGSETNPDHWFKQGAVTSLWAYMDGNGGMNGTQKVRLGLYYGTDPDHPTSDKVVMSDEVTITTGQPAGWVRFPVPYSPITFESIYGRFHVMMLSGGTQGVARYYSSNDANNWQGGPITYTASGPSELNFQDPNYPSGVMLSPGTGTISVYAEFVNTPATDFY